MPIPEAVERLSGLCEAMADSKYVLGSKLAELGPGAPSLEAATAACALAQGELGHARLLYKLAAELRGEAAEPWRQDGFRPACRGALPFVAAAGRGWLELIGALYVADTAFGLLISTSPVAAEPTLAPLEKVLLEQDHQLAYAEGWIGVLAQEGGRIPARMGAVLAGAAAQAEAWLATAGSHAAAEQLRRCVRELAGECGLALAP